MRNSRGECPFLARCVRLHAVVTIHVHEFSFSHAAQRVPARDISPRSDGPRASGFCRGAAPPFAGEAFLTSATGAGILRLHIPSVTDFRDAGPWFLDGPAMLAAVSPAGTIVAASRAAAAAVGRTPEELEGAA